VNGSSAKSPASLEKQDDLGWVTFFTQEAEVQAQELRQELALIDSIRRRLLGVFEGYGPTERGLIITRSRYPPNTLSGMSD
jgi:hypothetical protein